MAATVRFPRRTRGRSNSQRELLAVWVAYPDTGGLHPMGEGFSKTLQDLIQIFNQKNVLFWTFNLIDGRQIEARGYTKWVHLGGAPNGMKAPGDLARVNDIEQILSSS